MFEMIRRERVTRLSELEVSLIAMGGFLGAPNDRVANLLQALKKELRSYYTHEAFSAQRLIGRLRSKLLDLKQDRDIINKVDKLANL